MVRLIGAAVGLLAGLIAAAPAGAAPATYVLAVSWQPAFCEGASNKAECRTQTAERFDASHFTLHGLWPQPRSRDYCGVPDADRQADERSDWRQLPAVNLSPDMRKALDLAMPGTMSQLERHEWTKHGTCAGMAPDAYFGAALALLDQLNGSAVRTLFANGIGREVTGANIRAAFDTAFGAGAGARVRMACKRDGGRNLVVELTLGLRGDIDPKASLGRLMLGASPTDPGCPAGLVDPVGLQ